MNKIEYLILWIHPKYIILNNLLFILSTNRYIIYWNIHGMYSKNALLVYKCRSRYFDNINFLIENGVKIRFCDDKSLISASFNGRYNIVKF